MVKVVVLHKRVNWISNFELTPIYIFFSADDKEEIVTPEMPLFQSEEGKFLSTKKINPNKLTKSNHGKIESLLKLLFLLACIIYYIT